MTVFATISKKERKLLVEKTAFLGKTEPLTKRMSTVHYKNERRSICTTMRSRTGPAAQTPRAQRRFAEPTQRSSRHFRGQDILIRSIYNGKSQGRWKAVLPESFPSAQPVNRQRSISPNISALLHLPFMPRLGECRSSPARGQTPQVKPSPLPRRPKMLERILCSRWCLTTTSHRRKDYSSILRQSLTLRGFRSFSTTFPDGAGLI